MEEARKRRGGNKGEEMDDGKAERDAGHDFSKCGQVAGVNLDGVR